MINSRSDTYTSLREEHIPTSQRRRTDSKQLITGLAGMGAAMRVRIIFLPSIKRLVNRAQADSVVVNALAHMATDSTSKPRPSIRPIRLCQRLWLRRRKLSGTPRSST